MEEVMQSNSFFIIPLTIAYLTICALWFLLDRQGMLWDIVPIEPSKKPWLDFGISLIACIGVLGIGQLFSAGYLIPISDNKTMNQALIWPLNNVLIFSPILLALIIRKQSLRTILISRKDFLRKLTFGFIAPAIGVTLFVGIRDEWYRPAEIGLSSFQLEKLSNFPAIFFENIALAFLFVRLKWAVGTKWAIIIPSVLFALAHVPGSLAEGDPWGHVLIFFLLTGSLTTIILYTAYRSRDIIWLGVVHFVMDIAIKAF